MLKPLLSPFLLLCTLALLTSSCDKNEEEEDDKTKEAPPPVVKVEAATVGKVTATLGSTATVEARVRAELMVQVAGVVKEVRVEEGDAVTPGQVLAILDNPALEGEWQRARTEASRRAAEKNRLNPLFQKGFLSQADWDAVVQADETARAAKEQAQRSLAATTLTSPLRGTLTSRGLRVGEAVSPGAPAFSVADLTQLIVEVHLVERELARLHPGLPAHLVSDSLGGEPVPARVERVAPVVDAQTGSVKVTLRVEEGRAGALRPGMLVQAEVETETLPQAVLVPKKAVLYEDGEPYVYVVKEGKARRVPLELGYESGKSLEVRKGIAAGDAVVLVGQGALKDGVAVKLAEGPVPPGAAAPPAPPATPAPTKTGAAAPATPPAKP